MSPAPHIKKKLDVILAGVFALMLSLPAVCSLCQVPQYKSIDEHRHFADFPGFSSDLFFLQLYGKDLEKYYDDHFKGRELLIACRLKIERVLFPEVGAGPIIGRDGWFFQPGKITVDNFLGNTKLPLRRLKAQQVKLEEHRDLLAAQGIKYLVVIAPNKESVYPDYLPEWLKSSTTKTDQFVQYMRLHSTVEILDLRPVLRKARGPDPLFYKTDTHWNLMGAFIASEAIISKLSGQIPGLMPIAASDFEIQRMKGTGGNLARLAGDLALVENNMYAFKPKSQVPELKFYYLVTNQFNWSRFGTLPIPEPGILTTTNSRLATQAIIFGDSFAFELTPFLGCNFGKVTAFNQLFNLSCVDQNKPVLVIEEGVEYLFNRIGG
jgi:alginate O-acetyltransferase complex protein AlgJ